MLNPKAIKTEGRRVNLHENRNEELVRAAVWGASLLDGAPLAPMLADLGARMAAGQISEKIRNACTYALGNVEGRSEGEVRNAESLAAALRKKLPPS